LNQTEGDVVAHPTDHPLVSGASAILAALNLNPSQEFREMPDLPAKVGILGGGSGGFGACVSFVVVFAWQWALGGDQHKFEMVCFESALCCKHWAAWCSTLCL
jgi:hypothetical protein